MIIIIIMELRLSLKLLLLLLLFLRSLSFIRGVSMYGIMNLILHTLSIKEVGFEV